MAALSSIRDTLRDKVLYNYGYFQGRTFALPRSFSEVSGTIVSKVTSFAALPLPLLSFLAVPLYGGSSTTASLVFFYATWSILVMRLVSSPNENDLMA